MTQTLTTPAAPSPISFLAVALWGFIEGEKKEDSICLHTDSCTLPVSHISSYPQNNKETRFAAARKETLLKKPLAFQSCGRIYLQSLAPLFSEEGSILIFLKTCLIGNLFLLFYPAHRR